MTGTLTTAVASQSWDWLLAIARQLHVAIEIIDGRGDACLPAGSDGASPFAVRFAAGLASSDFRALAAKALRSGRCEREVIETLDVSICRLQTGPAAAGLLVIGRDGARSLAGDALSDIDALGSWLRPAVEAQLRRVVEDDGEGFDRVGSLHGLLQEAVDRGGEREVVTAFAEALFAWDGVEVSGYAEDIDGAFVLAVETPGSERGHASVPGARWPASLTRLSPSDLERFGFAEHRHVLAVEIAGGTLDPWLLVMAQGFGSLDQARLSLYLELLREGLSRAAVIHETRATWAIMQHLLGAADGVEPAIEAALGELTAAIPNSTAALAVTASSGANLLRVGDRPVAGADAVPMRRLASSQRVLDRYAMVLDLERPAGNVFTRRERHIVERAGEIFAAWLPGMLRQTAPPRDRRAEQREFTQVLDRAATQTTRDGMDVSMVVISAPDAARHPGLLHRWVSEIRGQLRGSDLAGALSDREIGVLLSGTSAECVPVVCGRFRRSLDGAGVPAATIGSASRTPDQEVVVDSLVAAARLHAVSHSGMTGRPS